MGEKLIGLVDGKELYKIAVGTEIELRKKSILTPNDGSIAGLRMMIEYPNTYKHSDKINPANLKDFLNYVYTCWILNFAEVYRRHQELVS